VQYYESACILASVAATAAPTPPSEEESSVVDACEDGELALMACTCGSLAGANPVPLAVAKLEALLDPRFTAAAQSESRFAKMLQLVYNRAVDDLDVDESDLEGEEIAAQFPISFHAA